MAPTAPICSGTWCSTTFRTASQINNSDPSTSVGNQVAAYYGCHLTGDIPLSILDDEQAMLRYDFNFAYTRVAMIQKFTEPTNVGQ